MHDTKWTIDEVFWEQPHQDNWSFQYAKLMDPSVTIVILLYVHMKHWDTEWTVAKYHQQRNTDVSVVYPIWWFAS